MRSAGGNRSWAGAAAPFAVQVMAAWPRPRRQLLAVGVARPEPVTTRRGRVLRSRHHRHLPHLPTAGLSVAAAVRGQVLGDRPPGAAGITVDSGR